MSARKSIAWAFSGQLVTLVASFSSSVVIARLLSPRELGVYAVAMATIGVIQLVAAFGVSSYLLRAHTIDESLLAAGFTANAILAVALSVIIFTVSWSTGWLIGDPAAGSVLRILSLGPLIGIPAFRPSTMLQREMRFKAISLIAVATSMVGAVVSVICAVRGLSSWSPAIGSLSASVVSTLGYLLCGRHHVGYRVSFAGWRAMSVFGLRMMSISGVSALVNRLTEIILGRVLGLAALGLYTRSSNLANMIFDNVYGTATRVIFIQLSKDYHERNDIRTTFLRSLRIITAVMWPLLLGLAILARPAIALVYGEQWLAAALPLSILLIAQVFTLTYGMNWELFVLKNETARQTRLELARSLVWLTLFTIGCQFGLAWAALGTALTALSGILFYFPHMLRLGEIKAAELVGLYAQSAVIALAAIAPSFALMMYSGWSESTPLWLVGAAVFIGAGFWLIALRLLRHPVLDEITIIVRRLTRRGAPHEQPQNT